MSLNNPTTSCSVLNHCGKWCSSGSSNSNSIYCFKILINFQIILIIYCIINLINGKNITEQGIGCNLPDHQACDELCKQDSYWYGHCSTWNGRDFTCTCYQYKVPLDGSLCKEMQQMCKEYCTKKGLEGGYCYVYASWKAPNGTTECECFEELSQPLR